MSIYPYLEKITSEQGKYINEFNLDKNIQFIEVNCPICFSSKQKKFFDNDRYNLRCKICLCLNCGLVFSKMQMDEKSLNYFYENYYRKIYEPNYNLNEYKEKLINFNFIYSKNPNFEKYSNSLFFEFINSNNLDYDSVFEIGTGMGVNLLYFKQINKKVSGLEPDKNCANILKDFIPDIKHGFLKNIDKSSDLVILKHVLEHLSDPINSLKIISKFSNKYLFIEVPGSIKYLQSVQNAHNLFFTPNTLNNLIINNGFKLLSLQICKENDFIFALYEKLRTAQFNYSFKKEVSKSKQMFQFMMLKYYIKKILKILKLL